jgi:hypothetical protein
MDATTSAVTTGLVVTVGRWSQGKGMEARVAIGAGILAVILSVIENGHPDLAGKFGTLILVSALMAYMVPIAKKLGYSK